VTTTTATATTTTSNTSSMQIKSRPLGEYNILNYLSYVLYAPLYMAGPIITFDSFMRYTVAPQTTESVPIYAFRWMYCFVLMELLTCHFPFFAVISSGILPHLTVAEMAVVMFVTLKMMWIKFLLIWRFFRLWALSDGISPPENMQRCMSNNSSLGEFWKGWHSSFNQWIVRYMYVPLGGRDTSMYTVWPIFLFVALWHDIEPKLIAWGLLNAVFFVIELAGQRFAKTSPTIKALPGVVFRFICTFTGATYILILIGVNMVGYSIGIGGLSLMLQKLGTAEGGQMLAVSYYFLFFGIKLMDVLKETGLSARR
jgi:D-alanyl-lipoteichoic acid acyltransferase DltB (MBOAT superfamily)